MSSLALGTTYDAVRAITHYWKNALPAERFATYTKDGNEEPAIFDKGEPEFVQPTNGAPWVSMRYTGPAEDGGGVYKDSKVPRYLSFAVRVYHSPDPHEGDGGDPYLSAQDLCLRGESDFEAMLAENYNVGNQVIDTTLLDGVTGDMEDAGGGAWYGHELLVTVQVH